MTVNESLDAVADFCGRIAIKRELYNELTKPKVSNAVLAQDLEFSEAAIRNFFSCSDDSNKAGLVLFEAAAKILLYFNLRYLEIDPNVVPIINAAAPPSPDLTPVNIYPQQPGQTFGLMLRQKRTELSLLAKDLADNVGIQKPKRIMNIEEGAVKVTFCEVVRIVVHLNMPLWDLRRLAWD